MNFGLGSLYLWALMIVIENKSLWMMILLQFLVIAQKCVLHNKILYNHSLQQGRPGHVFDMLYWT